jgi:hypothetical protein
MPYLVRLSVVVTYLERAISSVRASGCWAWFYLKWFGPSVAQPRPEAKYHGGCTEEDGREPDFEVAERQGDDAGGQQHYYPGHVVSGCQLGPQPTVAPKVSVLGEPLELRWIIHPDRHLTACAAPKPRPLLGRRFRVTSPNPRENRWHDAIRSPSV